jgi:hypothetical protein
VRLAAAAGRQPKDPPPKHIDLRAPEIPRRTSRHVAAGDEGPPWNSVADAAWGDLNYVRSAVTVRGAPSGSKNHSPTAAHRPHD